MTNSMVMRLQSLREASGCSFEALALVLNVDAESIEAWESDLTDAADQLELQQWAAWASALGLTLIELLAQIGLCAPGAVTPLTFQEFRDRVGALAGKMGSVHQVEELTGWELGEFIRNPEDGWSRKLGFFKSVAQVVGVDWRSVIASYGAPV
jgi:transcriptional regulator with XRE-family HTH domain